MLLFHGWKFDVAAGRREQAEGEARAALERFIALIVRALKKSVAWSRNHERNGIEVVRNRIELRRKSLPQSRVNLGRLLRQDCAPSGVGDMAITKT